MGFEPKPLDRLVGNEIARGSVGYEALEGKLSHVANGGVTSSLKTMDQSANDAVASSEQLLNTGRNARGKRKIGRALHTTNTFVVFLSSITSLSNPHRPLGSSAASRLSASTCCCSNWSDEQHGFGEIIWSANGKQTVRGRGHVLIFCATFISQPRFL